MGLFRWIKEQFNKEEKIPTYKPLWTPQPYEGYCELCYKTTEVHDFGIDKIDGEWLRVTCCKGCRDETRRLLLRRWKDKIGWDTKRGKYGKKKK